MVRRMHESAGDAAAEESQLRIEVPRRAARGLERDAEARELLGVAAYKHKKWSEARQAYTSLMSDPAAPQTIRQRAQTAMALIARETEAKKPNKATESGAGTSDLKKDKSAEDDGKSKGSTASGTPAAADGAGAKNDASKTQ